MIRVATAPLCGLPPPPSADVVHAALSEVCTASSFFAALPRWLVRTRTPFSAFLAFSFRSPHSRCGTAPASAIFPLPAPFLGIFQSSGPRLAKSEWRRLRLRRALHCVVMALNFLHDQLKWPSQTELLWRHPNPHQRRCFKRIWKFLIACDSRQEQMLLVPGRSGPELVCKLLELEHLASAICASSQGSYASSMLDEPFCEPQAGHGLPSPPPKVVSSGLVTADIVRPAHESPHDAFSRVGSPNPGPLPSSSGSLGNPSPGGKPSPAAVPSALAGHDDCAQALPCLSGFPKPGPLPSSSGSVGNPPPGGKPCIAPATLARSKPAAGVGYPKAYPFLSDPSGSVGNPLPRGKPLPAHVPLAQPGVGCPGSLGKGPGSFGKDKLLLDTVPSIQPDSSLPQLQPYRPLDVSRLRISGRGNWDAKLWLDGVLWLPYQEPKILQHGLDPTWADLPDVSLESPTENHRLALLWSTQNILHLKRGPPNLRTACRVFNAFKDDSRDRQIGDRRAQNCLEYSISGPSKNLPC